MSLEKANLFIITAPSGTGKTTMLRRLISELPDLVFSVSHTTRQPRLGETNGVDYFFVSNEEFNQICDSGGFLEWALVHENQYGTSQAVVQQKLQAGMDVVLDIDVAGADQVRKKNPDAISIFIMPPSLDSLRTRLYGRNQDTAQVIEKRLMNARLEIKQAFDFDYVIINDDFETCYRQLKSVFTVNRLKVSNSLQKIQRMIANCF